MSLERATNPSSTTARLTNILSTATTTNVPLTESFIVIPGSDTSSEKIPEPSSSQETPEPMIQLGSEENQGPVFTRFEIESLKEVISAFEKDINDIPDQIMPPETLPISDLIFLKKTSNEPEKKTSAHRMDYAQNINSTDPTETLFFKRTIPDEYEFDDKTVKDNPITELELLNATVAQWLNGDYVPNTMAYFNKYKKYVGLTSVLNSEFKPNKDKGFELREE